MDFEKALKEHKDFRGIATELAQELHRVGITSKKDLGNAPVRMRTTYGADIYAVEDYLRNYKPKAKPRATKTEEKE